MKTIFLKFSLVLTIIAVSLNAFGWDGMPMPKLHIEGRYLKDASGHIVNLHGFAQTYSPWFNEQDKYWTNYDVAGCLDYNKGIIDGMLAADWKINFIRLHMDPYWSNTPGVAVTGEADISAFNFTRFKKYLDEVFIPMAEYAISKGLYVVMRPPGVCPEKIAVNDMYNKYLIKVWGCVAQHAKLKNNSNVMFELANEPVNILGPDGTYGSGSQGHFDNLKTYFQAVVDTIRASANNIIWAPGLGYQALYQGYAINPIEGDNIGYAVHVYPGWFNSGKGYENFQKGWENQVQPVADFAPIIVTEMDWAPERHNKSWGKDSTGVAGKNGFGANFKKIADDCGNVSWLLFTSPDLLAQYGDATAPADIIDFLSDPEACPKPVYQWYQAYASEYGLNGASENYLKVSDFVVESGKNMTILTKSSAGLKINAVFADGHIENVSSLAEISVDKPEVVNVVRGRIFALVDGEATLSILYTDPKGTAWLDTVHVTSTTFPLTNQLFNPDIWGDGTFDETTQTLTTGQWGFGGWTYSNGLDISGYKYLVAKLGSKNNAGVSFRVFDENNYWAGAAEYDFGNKQMVVANTGWMPKKDQSATLNPSHIYIVGFWSNGNIPFVIDSVFLSNSSEYDALASIKNETINKNDGSEIVDVYNLLGVKVMSKVKKEQAIRELNKGVYLIGKEKVVILRNRK